MQRTRLQPGRTVLAVALLYAAVPAVPADEQALALIPAGSYPIGSDSGPADSRPAHRVELAAFRIDRHEVSNAEFVRFLESLRIEVLRDARAGRVPRSAVAGADAARLFFGAPGGSAQPYIELDDEDARIELAGGRLRAAPGHARHPVTETTWFGARAYCAWRGARLPSEAEWEAAARGPQGRSYPWGEAAPDPQRANFARRRGETGARGTRPRGATPEGVHDLAGNLAEWTSSLYRPYPYRAGDGREEPGAAGERVTRGGDYVFDSAPEQLRGYFRGGFSRAPEHGHRHIGFRCVAAP